MSSNIFLKVVLASMDNLSPVDVRHLLNRITIGDDQAGRILYGHYKKQLFAYVRFRVWSDDSAEEIVQDTLFVALSKPDSYDGVVAFSTWLCGIANNKILDWRRKAARSREDSTPDEELEMHAGVVWGVLDQLEQEERSAAILACIDKLPEGQRVAMYWTAVEEASLSETSGHLCIPEGTVKSRLFHARLRIRQCLDGAMDMAYRRMTNG